MKKLTILFSILIASVSAYAASTLQITLSSASQADKVLQIIVDNPFSDAYDNGYDAVIGANQDGGLYICSGSERYSLWATNSIAANLPMGFGSVADDEYTLSFQYFTGAAFEIYDRIADKTITVNSASNILIDGVAADPANKYTFTLGTGEAHNAAINDRFVFNYTTASIKGTGDWWGLGKDVDLAIAADGKTATGSLTFDAAGTYNFKVVRGSDWLSDVTEFTRNENERAITATEDGGMWFTIDAIGASNEYAFTWTFATNTLTIGFPAAPAPAYAAEVTTNEYGLATFSHASDLAPVEAGVKLYKGAVSGETLALTPVADIAAGQGVIVYGEANTTYHFNVINGATADFAGNQLLAATAWESPHPGFDTYVLSGNALYLYEGTLFPEHKAFLKIAQSANPSPRRIRLVFDQATAIDNISADNVKAEKVVENGQILIRRGNEVYNLQGQIVK